MKIVANKNSNPKSIDPFSWEKIRSGVFFVETDRIAKYLKRIDDKKERDDVK
jgi:hypothetical protein